MATIPDASLYKNLELETKVAEASPHELIQMLFDEALISLKRAIESSNHSQIPERDAMIIKASNVLSYLHQCLSEDGESELPHRLGALYEYMLRQLLAARIHKDDARISEVISLIEPIAEGWRSIS